MAEVSSRNVLSRVVLRNYKSIRACDVSLGPLTFLVGPNGSGKSNFVEALRLLSYSLNNSLEKAIADRSGVQSILYRGSSSTHTIAFELFLNLENRTKVKYVLEIDAQSEPSVAREECVVEREQRRDWFRVNQGIAESNQPVAPAASRDRLYLINASGLAPFEPVYRALSSILVYNPVPDEIRGFHAESRFRNLDRAGTTLAETVFRMALSSPKTLERITDYLRKINPSVAAVNAVDSQANYSLRFELNSDDDRGAQEFLTQNLSDGTLRALAILTALFQKNDRYPLDVVCLEEPEAGLHPAAAGVLFDGFVEASQDRQLIVTSHSPDLLDREDIPDNALKAVAMVRGETIIGDADEVGRNAMHQRLYTAGELMRMDQLKPENLAT